MIYVIRHQQVMIDSDLAMLYQVETRVLNQAVKRNISRFPEREKPVTGQGRQLSPTMTLLAALLVLSVLGILSLRYGTAAA